MMMKIDTLLPGLIKASFSDHDSVKVVHCIQICGSITWRTGLTFKKLYTFTCCYVIDMRLCRRKGRKKIFCFPLKIVELEGWEILKVERKSSIGIRLTQVKCNVYSNTFEYKITTDIEAWGLLGPTSQTSHIYETLYSWRSIINTYIRGIITKFFWYFRFFSPLVTKHTLMLSLFSDVRAFRALDCKSCDSTLCINYHFFYYQRVCDITFSEVSSLAKQN